MVGNAVNIVSGGSEIVPVGKETVMEESVAILVLLGRERDRKMVVVGSS
jgi:hypothetical protein